MVRERGANTSVMLHVRVDLAMKVAAQALAERELISLSALIKRAIDRYLIDAGVDWRYQVPTGVGLEEDQ